MPKKAAVFTGDLEPLDRGLPPDVAATIGGILTQHAYLDWVLGQVMYSLMEISIKQGRIIMKIPRPKVYVTAVRDLFRFHGLAPRYDFDGLSNKLDEADKTRRLLTRSVYMHDPAVKGAIHLVRGMWDPGPGGESQPESQLVDREFLERRRKDLDDAVKAAEALRSVTDDLLRRLHEERRGRAISRGARRKPAGTTR